MLSRSNQMGIAQIFFHKYTKTDAGEYTADENDRTI